MHFDVLRSIQQNYFNRVKSGEVLSNDELHDYMMVTNEVTDRNIQRTDETTEEIKELGNRLDEFVAWKSRQQKILIGFLKLHNLQWEYANYVDRIDRRLERNKPKSERSQAHDKSQGSPPHIPA